MGSRLRREYDIRMEETLADAEFDIIIDEMLDDAEDIVHGSRSTQMREELFLRSYRSFCLKHPQFKSLVPEGKDLSGPADDLIRRMLSYKVEKLRRTAVKIVLFISFVFVLFVSFNCFLIILFCARCFVH
jgi:hypothetical protein